MDAPSIDEFQTVWANLEAGQRCRRGIAAIGSEKRVFKMSGCLYEALRESDSRFLQQADVIWLARDARQGRLLVRFKAAHFAKGAIHVKHGILGQAKNFGTSAQEILDATKNIIIRACTETGLATKTPRGAPSDLLKHLGHRRGGGVESAGVEGVRHMGEGRLHGSPRCQKFAGAAEPHAAAEQLAGEIFQKIEAITVDSATDELLSGELMRGECQLPHAHATALTPNLRLVLRDVTHASRRPAPRQYVGRAIRKPTSSQSQRACALFD